MFPIRRRAPRAPVFAVAAFVFVAVLAGLTSASAAFAQPPRTPLATAPSPEPVSKPVSTQPVSPPTSPSTAEPKPDAPALGRVSIADLQELAARNHPALEIADRRVEAERGVYLQSGLRPNPTLRYEAEEIGSEGSAGKQGVVVEQEFGGGERRRLAQTASARSIEELNEARRIAELKVRNDVRAAAYRLLVAQKKVEFRRQIASISLAAEDQGRASFAAGELSQLNLIQLQNQTRQAKIDLSQELNAQEAAKKRLLALVGLPNATLDGLTDDPENLGADAPLDENATLDDLLNRSPEIERRRAAIRQKQAALAFERTPQKSFSVSGGVSFDFADNSTLAQAGVGLPIRINDRNEGNVRRATAEYFAAQRELERAQLKLRAEFAETFAEYKSALEETLTYRREINPDLEKFFAMSQQAFQHGEIDFLEVSVARVTYVESSVAYLDALERLAESIVKIEGALLDKSLDE